MKTELFLALGGFVTPLSARKCSHDLRKPNPFVFTSHSLCRFSVSEKDIFYLSLPYYWYFCLNWAENKL
ncbi:hypothetical protein EVA_13583 [gut metagenome]|uniref:Uncharacterized protein n=1 Tax=gut metagenome TaxID=749906 RepID=J9G964_9ZZZZ